MNINEIKLSVSQINKMKHAVGLNMTQSEKRPVAYRNYFATGDDPEWNEIVDFGLAVKRSDPFCKDDFVYHLTEDGIEFLSKVIDKKIIVMK